MSTFTENYDFIKPGNEDFYDIQDFNENMDASDAQLAQAEERVAAVQAGIASAEEKLGIINAKIGSPADSGKNTIFGCLQNTPTSIVKSIQYVEYSIAKETDSGSVAIQEVNPEKCFVIFERLENGYTTLTRLQYKLTATALNFSHQNISYMNIKSTLFGFWIIELY